MTNTKQNVNSAERSMLFDLSSSILSLQFALMTLLREFGRI
jgi:hypothetical protein